MSKRIQIFKGILWVVVGLATATGAAAVGVIGSLVLAAGAGSLSWGTLTESLMGATRTSAMIALILAGAAFLSLSMGFTGLPRGLADLISSFELTRFELLMVLLVFYIVLGMFLDGISSVVLTMAVVEPMVREAGIDLIWFGVVYTITMEIAVLTPPVGLNLYVIQAISRDQVTIGDVIMGCLPFIGMMVLLIALLIGIPDLALWLPEQLQ